VRVALGDLGRDGDREARLADAARPRQRDKTRLLHAEEPEDVRELLLAADERRRRHRNVRGVQRAKRRELALPELVQPERPAEVLETVQAQIGEQETVAWLQEAGRALGDEHLAAVACSRDAGGGMHVDSDVALVGRRRLAGVDAHPHAHRRRLQRLPAFLGGHKRVRGAGEGVEEGVALGVDLDAAVARERLPQ